MTLRNILVFMAAALCLPLPALAEETTPPWQEAATAWKATTSDLQKNGVRGIAPHVDALEDALKGGSSVDFKPYQNPDGSLIVLTDGLAETIAAMAAAAQAKQNTKAFLNPYPIISLALGSYYNEVGRPQDALRVLAEGLALSNPLHLGATRPKLYSEEAAAFGNLKDWTHGVAACEEGLQIPAMDNGDRARLYRSRGFDLVELGQLDDGEKSYQESLKLDPQNQIALQELNYIARLRAGGNRAPTAQILPQPAKPAQQPPASN
jgi:tetratricopeptide (TPR) repeat protein